ncbi:hypothetical protein BpHYR1_038214 [Brachionus plicatilis]|uniref:CCHC-type domain-containing protein n=1 Tax=Brachionus plicatilis TaxID=10195 RepID=A0A3M7PCG0_BRAPC|nr:hypothetical protein BpHYR1_038214 [Brachionus plicatilis]
MDETLELLSIIATALFGTSIETKKVVEDVVVPKSWFEHYLKIMETTWTDYYIGVIAKLFSIIVISTWYGTRRRNKTLDDKFNRIDERLDQLMGNINNRPQDFICSNVNTNRLDIKKAIETTRTSYMEARRQTSPEISDSTLTTQTSDIGPPKSCSTPTTKQAREWYNDHNRIEGQPKKVLIEEVNPTAPRTDNTFVYPSRQVRFKMPNTLSQLNSGQKIETINPYPILFVSPPDKFDPKRTDVRQWIKDFDMFIESNNINSHKLNIVIAHLDHETRKIIENSQFTNSTEEKLLRIWNLKDSSQKEFKVSTKTSTYASQLKVMSKQSHYELLPYQRDNLVKEQFRRGLRDKFLLTRLQIIREDMSLKDIIEEAARYVRAVEDVQKFPERTKKVDFEEKIQKHFYKPQQTHNLKTTQQQNTPGSDQIICYNCKQEGQYSRSCPQKPKYTHSILSAKTCRKLRLKPKKSSIELHYADGNKIGIIGRADVDVKINNESYKIGMIIVENLVNEMILGVDDLNKFRSPRRLVNSLKKWTSSTLCKLEPGKFKNPIKKLTQMKSKIETTQKETNGILKANDASKITGKVCKTTSLAVINKIQEKTSIKKEFSEEQLENARKKIDEKRKKSRSTPGVDNQAADRLSRWPMDKLTETSEDENENFIINNLLEKGSINTIKLKNLEGDLSNLNTDENIEWIKVTESEIGHQEIEVQKLNDEQADLLKHQKISKYIKINFGE